MFLTPTEPVEVEMRIVAPEASDPLMTFSTPVMLTLAERGMSAGCFS